MDLGSEIQKTNVGIRISIVNMPCMPVFRKNGQLWPFQLKFAQDLILGREFQKSKSRFGICTAKFSQKGNQDLKFRKLMLEQESASLRHHAYQFSDKTDNFEFLGPNLSKNGFWSRNFKDLSLDSKSASLRYYAHQCSEIKDNFEFLGPNLPKKEFWGRNFKNLTLDSKSTPPIYYVRQFSVKMDNF